MSADITVQASCLMPEKLIERAVSQGARFAGLRLLDGRTLIADCDAASAEILLDICRRFSIPTRVLSRRGVSGLYAWVRGRRTLIAGLAICAALCWLFLGRIWIIDAVFTGENAAAGDASQLERAIERAGIHPGLSRGLDAGVLAQSLLASEDGLSYVGARVQGIRLLVEAAPEVPAPPLYDVEAGRDLVSGLDGIVVTAVARSGELCVKPGDAVRRGQLLIRGEERSAVDETRPIAALGEVVLRTWIEGAASLSPNVDRDVYTGRTSISDSLCLFALRLPITEGEAFEEARVEARRMGVGGLYLPLALERLTRREVRHTVERADPALIQARLAPLARADAALRLALEGPRDCEIVRSWIDYEETPGALRARAVYEIHTNAAVTREALLKGWR